MTDRILILVGVAAIFIYIWVLFFSSFLTYPEGVRKAFEAYSIWTKTGSKDHTQNGTWAYLKWGMEIEAPIMILSAVGTVIAFLLYYWLIHNMDVTKTMLIALVTPVAAVVLGMLVLKEEMHWRTLIGGAMIISGLGLNVFRRRRKSESNLVTNG